MFNKIKIQQLLLTFFLMQNVLQAQSSKNYFATDGIDFLNLTLLLIFLGLIFLSIRKYLGFEKISNLVTKANHFAIGHKNVRMEFANGGHHHHHSDGGKKCDGDCNNSSCKGSKTLGVIALLMFFSQGVFAQTNKMSDFSDLLSQPGIIITIVLMLIPLFLGGIFAIIKAQDSIRFLYAGKHKEHEGHDVEIKNSRTEFEGLSNAGASQENANLSFQSADADILEGEDLIFNVSNKHEVHFTAVKKRSVKRPSLPPDITKLILWYLGFSVFWLIVGTGIGEYVGIKFVLPEADSISWLSFGRLRPVHTNIVFWGWASLGMIGLGYYVVPMVSNNSIFSIKLGWIALLCTNLMIIFGTICLMAGINNGGGEFREYIWPVMALFAVALILTLINFFMTVARRKTKEIYISNWYIVSSIIFTIIVALTAYLPFWQDGVSETIVQGYFMHSGVGMWFTLYTLGLLYYFIPQQLNKPIYAYSLGILAFWTQILFYTIIGTHHFIFAPIPWWLQTVGIVGSAGMIIPVVAAVLNYLMTFKGQWHKVTNTYTVPFFFVAVVYYFIVSIQGTAEAFKYTNLLWHFTDFTVAHAHLGFYGIITFAIWGGIYTIVPRLTGKEPIQMLVGAHFWLAFIGLLLYTIPLSVGATLRGLMWMEGAPFIDSVVMMFDWWLWRAIGGSLMFLSHLIFMYNFYQMTCKKNLELEEA